MIKQVTKQVTNLVRIKLVGQKPTKFTKTSNNFIKVALEFMMCWQVFKG